LSFFLLVSISSSRRSLTPTIRVVIIFCTDYEIVWAQESIRDVTNFRFECGCPQIPRFAFERCLLCLETVLESIFRKSLQYCHHMALNVSKWFNMMPFQGFFCFGEVTLGQIRRAQWLLHHEVWLWRSRNGVITSMPIYLQLTDRGHLRSTPLEQPYT
jgi:hypothetical protein